MALYNCPGCQQPISETQPLDHCMHCIDMNERQRERSNRGRASSAPEARTARPRVRYMAVLIIFRVPAETLPSPSPTPPRQCSECRDDNCTGYETF